jgi:hypothetical protein
MKFKPFLEKNDKQSALLTTDFTDFVFGCKGGFL